MTRAGIADSQAQAEEAVSALAHYVLLALEPEQMDLAPTCLTLAADFVLGQQASVGFDLSPARQAARVTVIGRLDPVVAEELTEGGIRVDQVAADPFTLHHELEALS